MEIELDLNLERRDAGLLAAGLLLGTILTLTGLALTSNSGPASQNLVSFLENQSDQSLEVVQARSAGEFYRVNVKTGGNQLKTYYTNGKIFTTNMQNIEQLQNRLTALKDFQQCLKNSGTVMFGNASQRATQAQIQALGGTQVVAPIYRDVSNQSVLATAVKNGVQRVPAFYRNGSIIQGVQTLNQVEQFTGCNYQTN